MIYIWIQKRLDQNHPLVSENWFLKKHQYTEFMEENTESYQKIIHTYNILHKLFFGIGIFLLLIMLSAILSRKLIHRSNSYPIRTISQQEKEKSVISTMDNSLHQYDNHETIKLFIRQGALTTDSSHIISNNNLITYKWFVLPNKINLTINNELQSLDHFTKTGTVQSDSDLANYAKTILFVDNKDDKSDNKTWSLLLSLPQWTNFLDYFRVNCVIHEKVTDQFCNKVVSDMVKMIPAYNLSNDFSSLHNILKNLEKNPYKVPFCDTVKQYIFSSSDIGDDVKTLMNNCGGNYKDFYGYFSAFRSIKSQLEKQTVSPSVTSNSLLNAYKLVSLQQIIYNEISEERFNEVRLNSYIQYVQELLRRQNALEGFYFNSTAWFNNQYLLPALSSLITTKQQESKDIKSVIEWLRSINEGDSLSKWWYEWLIKRVNNPIIVGDWSRTIIDTTVVKKRISDSFQENYSFQNFIVTKNVQLSDTELEIEGVFQTSNSPLKALLRTNLILWYNKQKFIIKKAIFTNYPILSNNITIFLTNNKEEITIPELFDLLIKDGLRLSKETISIDISQLEKKKDGWNDTIPKDSPKNLLLTGAWDLLQIKGDFSSIGISTKNIKKIDTKNANDKLYTVSYTLQSIDMVAIYNLSTQEIIRIVLVVGSENYPLKAFVLPIKNTKSNDVMLFSSDPKIFLLSKDAVGVKKALN